MIGVNILQKLAKLINYKNFHKKKEAIFMSAEIIFSVFQVTLPHPQLQINYGTYRIKELSIKENLFLDKNELDPAELL